jgi:hypothetical protein
MGREIPITSNQLMLSFKESMQYGNRTHTCALRHVNLFQRFAAKWRSGEGNPLAAAYLGASRLYMRLRSCGAT